MSIRMIAQELYLLEQAVAKIEEQIRHAAGTRRTELEEQLRKATADRNRMRNALHGHKSNAPASKRVF